MTEVDSKGRELVVPKAALALPPHVPAGGRAAQGATGGEGSFGRALAAAREARGLSQADVAAELRMHVRQVKAIEAEDLAALPAGPFVRGYVRNFARVVDLPAEPLLALLNTKLQPTDPLHATGSGAVVSPLQRTPGEPRSGRIVVGGALVALALLAAFGWWSMRTDEKSRAVALPPAAPPAALSQPPVTEAPVAPATTAEPAAAAPAAEAADSPVVAQASAVPPAAGLRLRFRDRSWVEIRQADGTVLMSQNNAAGSERTIDGVPPYLLVIGNASKVDLEFRGSPVDLAAVTNRDDVARLRLE